MEQIVDGRKPDATQPAIVARSSHSVWNEWALGPRAVLFARDRIACLSELGCGAGAALNGQQ
jgi:hypothetical protein